MQGYTEVLPGSSMASGVFGDYINGATCQFGSNLYVSPLRRFRRQVHHSALSTCGAAEFGIYSE